MRAMQYSAWSGGSSRRSSSAKMTLKEAVTWSAVSVSVVSRDMKSMKAWKVTMPIRLGSTMLMMRENSFSSWWRQRGTVGDGKNETRRKRKKWRSGRDSGGKYDWKMNKESRIKGGKDANIPQCGRRKVWKSQWKFRKEG
ncbi:hypothetical protein EYF80_024152 [Liparis tanakae]|uniref:Uncharacterized protein n=1 Tax=Liparis tanakae TaxID=230148 RepID=A0A4Z2HKW1_9TELE|nr:hypothetical protein EYF80_024152 [Liparis tanakae]